MKVKINQSALQVPRTNTVVKKEQKTVEPVVTFMPPPEKSGGKYTINLSEAITEALLPDVMDKNQRKVVFLPIQLTEHSNTPNEWHIFNLDIAPYVEDVDFSGVKTLSFVRQNRNTSNKKLYNILVGHQDIQFDVDEEGNKLPKEFKAVKETREFGDSDNPTEITYFRILFQEETDEIEDSREATVEAAYIHSDIEPAEAVEDLSNVSF